MRSIQTSGLRLLRPVRCQGQVARTRGCDGLRCRRPPDPWVTEHPEWFSKRADGSIAYAENPPKKYPGHLPHQLRQ